VEKVDLAPSGTHPSISIVTDQGETAQVLVAPIWYLEDHSFSVKSGDELTVTFAEVNIAGESRKVALELKQRDGKTLRLRDERGLPLWTIWKRGHRGHCCHNS
jgi:hypothetical protein